MTAGAPWGAWVSDPDALPDVVARVGDGALVLAGASGPIELGAHELVLLERIDRFQAPVVGDDPARELLRSCGLIGTEELSHPGIAAAGDGALDRADDEPAGDLAATPARRVPTETAGPDRVPVYAVWHESVGPLLALGMLTAAARHHRDGALTGHYDIRRPETASSVLADLDDRTGPAILLCSDYVWSLAQNLELARRARRVNPDLLIIHGGPSSPKYEADAARFLEEHGDVADVLVRGEGEVTICAVLEALAGDRADPAASFDLASLSGIEGLTFRHPDTGAIVRTPDRPRLADLDSLPSPYLTGEFDHIPSEAWHFCMTVETNRGCPYGCTFCDWGAATMSRIRKFDLARVVAELEWAVGHGAMAIDFADANFGLLARDVEIAGHLAALKRERGSPEAVIYYPAKNTTKHLLQIIELFSQASISTIAAVALQSTDPVTLEAIQRSNISLEAYVSLAADHRRRGHVVQGELLLGLPGQTYDSFRLDLQFVFDHEMFTRIWPVQVLPNSPMNEPGYRRQFGIRTNDDALVLATSSFSEEDRARMLRLRTLYAVFEQYGLMRHVLRWLQWDRGVPASEVMDRVLDVVERDPRRYPHLRWVVSYFDLIAAPPEGWEPFFDDVARFVADEYGIERSSALDCVLELNRFLLPEPGRSFPARLSLAHDYVSYYRSATAGLYVNGESGRPEHALDRYPAADLIIDSDPLGLCRHGLHFVGESRNLLMTGDFHMATAAANELWSPLARLLPALARQLDAAQIDEFLGERKGPEPRAREAHGLEVALETIGRRTPA